MAVSTYYYRDEPVRSYRVFLCDTEADISSLPTKTRPTPEYPDGTPVGSKAFVIAGCSVWVLNNQDVWCKL